MSDRMPSSIPACPERPLLRKVLPSRTSDRLTQSKSSKDETVSLVENYPSHAVECDDPGRSGDVLPLSIEERDIATLDFCLSQAEVVARRARPEIVDIIKSLRASRPNSEEAFTDVSEEVDPTYPGILIASLLQKLGMPAGTAARYLGIARQNFYKMISGEISVTTETAVRLEKGFGVRAERWSRIQATYEINYHRRQNLQIDRLKPVLPRAKPKGRYDL